MGQDGDDFATRDLPPVKEPALLPPDVQVDATMIRFVPSPDRTSEGCGAWGRTLASAAFAEDGIAADANTETSTRTNAALTA